ncbi:hypothetical protein Dimus_007331 [Dionaea muscipula]
MRACTLIRVESPFCIMGMSNPESSDPIQSQCNISSTPTITSSINSEILHQPQQLQLEHNPEHDNYKAETEEAEAEAESCLRHCTIPSSTGTAEADPHKTTPSSGEFKVDIAAVDDDDVDETNDGFTTPTYPDTRIPEIRPCPPPPRKKKNIHRSWPPPAAGSSSRRRRRRKLWSSTSDARVLLDLSKEVESMFPPIIQANFGRKIKRARSC